MNPFAGVLDYLTIIRRHLGHRVYSVFVLTMFGALAEGLGITLVLPLLSSLDVGVAHGNGGPVVVHRMLEGVGLAGSTVGILLLIGLAFLLKGLIIFAAGGYGGYLQAQLLRELKGKLFDSYSNMSYPYYAGKDTGHFINVINTQAGGFLRFFGSYVAFLSQLIRASIYLLIALLLAWQFGVMAIAGGGFLLFMFRGLNRIVKELSRNTSSESGVLNKLLVQCIQAFKYLASTHGIGRVRGVVMGSIDRLTDYAVRQRVWGAFTSAIAEPVSLFLMIGIVIVQVSVLQQPLAPIFVSLILFHRGMHATLGIQKNWQDALNAAGSVEMVETELNELLLHREPNGMRWLEPLNETVVMEDIHFGYSPEHPDVLHGIHLTIPARTTIALVGESGAGKSTLVDLLTLLLKPSRGRILIDGIPGSEIDLASWRTQIGYVSQETVVFDDTIAANIALDALPANGDGELLARVEEAARRAHLAHYIEDLPDGYLTIVGDRGIRLSGGQRQRLFIARELFKKPNLLILDEATSALDTDSERAIQKSIDDLHGAITVIIIAHRLSTIKNVDKVFLVDRGEIVESGGYDELRNRPNSRFSSMLDMQSL